MIATILSLTAERFIKDLSTSVFRGQEGTVLANFAVGLLYLMFYLKKLIKKTTPPGLLFTLILCSACCLFATAQPYKKLHFKSIVIDTHNDFPSTAIEKKLSLDQDLKGKTHTDLARIFEGGLDAQIFSIWCDGEQQNPYAWANREIDSVYEWCRRNPDRMVIY